MAVTPSDDGFREIQLNGKQLVFLFMAVTVVLVVTFLTGVLVGRGVRAERAEAAQAEALTEPPPTPERSVEPVAAGADDPRQAAPPEPVESAEPPVAAPRNPELEEAKIPEPQPKPAAPPAAAPDKREPAAAAAAPKAVPTAAKVTTPPAEKPAAAPAARTETAGKPAPAPAVDTTIPSAPPSGPRNGYAVQVAAVNARPDAEAIVRRLSAKGYAAYVEVPKSNASVFRVRVGTFRTRREAQSMADRLRKEEKFKPWVTR